MHAQFSLSSCYYSINISSLQTGHKHALLAEHRPYDEKHTQKEIHHSLLKNNLYDTRKIFD